MQGASEQFKQLSVCIIIDDDISLKCGTKYKKLEKYLNLGNKLMENINSMKLSENKFKRRTLKQCSNNNMCFNGDEKEFQWECSRVIMELCSSF